MMIVFLWNSFLYLFFAALTSQDSKKCGVDTSILIRPICSVFFQLFLMKIFLKFDAILCCFTFGF